MSNYLHKLEKYKSKYHRYHQQLEQQAGDCTYSDTQACGILETGRCGLISKSDLSDKEKDQCICNDISGYCVKTQQIRGLRVMVKTLEDKLKRGEIVTLPPPPSPVSDAGIEKRQAPSDSPSPSAHPLAAMLQKRQAESQGESANPLAAMLQKRQAENQGESANPLAAMMKKRQAQMEGQIDESSAPQVKSAKVNELERRLKFGQPPGAILIDINKYLDDPSTTDSDKSKLEKLKASISSRANVAALGSSGLDKLINNTNSGLLENKAKLLAEKKEKAGGNTFFYDNTIELYEELMSFQTEGKLTPKKLIANIKKLYDPIKDKIDPGDVSSWERQFQKLQTTEGLSHHEPLQDKEAISHILYGLRGKYKGLLGYLEAENKKLSKDVISKVKKLMAKLRVALTQDDDPIRKKDQEIAKVYDKLDQIQENKVIKDIFGKLKGDKDLRLINRASLFSDNNLNLVRPDLQKTIISDKLDTDHYGLPDTSYLDDDDDDKRNEITRADLIKQQNEYFVPPYMKPDPNDKQPGDWDKSQGEWKPQEIRVDNCSTYFNERAKGPFAGPEWTAKMKKRECKLCKDVLDDKNNFYDPTSKFCINCCGAGNR